MPKLRIRIYDGDTQEPETTVSIPTGVLKIAFKLIPNQAKSALHEQGIELEELVRLAENPEPYGELLEVMDHKKNQRVVITLE